MSTGMDQRELESCIKQLNKIVQANEPPATALALLERLKKEAAPTEEMLRSSRAGVFVGKLRSNSNKEIARAATELVHKWKKLVEAEKQGKIKKQSSPAAPSPTQAPAPKPSSSNAMNQPFKGNPELRRAKSDGCDTKRTGDETRDSCIELIYNGLAYRSTASVTDVLAKAVAVEHAAFSHYKGVTKEYREKLRSLFSNLKVKSNRQLGVNVMEGKIAPERFVVMTHEELKSEEQRKKEDALQLENMKKAQVPMAEKSISDALKCGKCGQKKVSYSQAQTRSADEPMTTFCECTVCGNRWKFS
ncbi:transcription elongation factor S-II [Colletotrichum higginsianum]|uniref:Transcription elongation factor n=4 Tax=Colletotrichum destructivum species complex TaxID=2707350 RepID=H1VXG0_COLHI|nr:Transcription elongation factor S-II [Colletotrichum higginsianum IMI 349063]OBR10088.1 Transcription elongation factor S-II [Colletotrichum higginsianum IMI 349063]TID06317.1 Transcription elongation factor S-II [Colletotrichum higginsianum]WQF87247.1 Putative Zinc finger, TFIIS-type, transcription elongation factor S-II, central [Colletotrichum destructivum]CCF44922.1 transcription elongation factor S-II [Colletotrichum higginsianum]